jgi:hypothetical protein
MQVGRQLLRRDARMARAQEALERPDSSCLSNRDTLRQNPQTLMIAGATRRWNFP